MRALLEGAPREVLVVDNLLSSERENLPDDPALRLIEASINDDDVLAALPRDLEYVFHLSTYHGNQSSMADPLADHEHNTLTTLKLYEALKDHDRVRRVVYASAGCTVAEKTFEGASATQEDAPVSLYLDSPYQISKIIGEYYSNYYFQRHGLPAVKARFQNVYGPGEVLGAGRWRGTVNTVWRNVTPTFIYKALNHEALPIENGGIASRDFIYVGDMAQGPDRVRDARRAGRRLQPRERRRDHDPRARRADQRADGQPDADRAHAGARLGPLRASATATPRRRDTSSASRRPCRSATGWSARSPGRGRTAGGSRRASPGTQSGWRPPEPPLKAPA